MLCSSYRIHSFLALISASPKPFIYSFLSYPSFFISLEVLFSIRSPPSLSSHDLRCVYIISITTITISLLRCDYSLEVLANSGVNAQINAVFPHRLLLMSLEHTSYPRMNSMTSQHGENRPAVTEHCHMLCVVCQTLCPTFVYIHYIKQVL